MKARKLPLNFSVMTDLILATDAENEQRRAGGLPVKTTTIRAKRRANPPLPGVELHMYAGLRARAVRLLRIEECVEVEPVRFVSPGSVYNSWHVLVGERDYSWKEEETFLREVAMPDGFDSVRSFFSFFTRAYRSSLDRTGFERIRWNPTDAGLEAARRYETEYLLPNRRR